jgi:GTP-binding protein LepA
MTTPIEIIRNFSIIAHIDHGKSTLADRMLELTGTVDKRLMREQVLDTMELERERGITIKAQNARMSFTAADGETYELNLIDTPGHVDFTYEVSRALAACEGVLLVVDATQGVEAQTVANMYLAAAHDLVIIPVINKVDLDTARPEHAAEEVLTLLGNPDSPFFFVSAKTGEGVPELLQGIVDLVPPPAGDLTAPLRALVYDAFYDDYLGIVTALRVVDGVLGKGDEIEFYAHGGRYVVSQLGYFAVERRQLREISAGEVGYFTGAVKELAQVKIGDTLIHARGRGKVDPLPGYREPKPVVFCGLYPSDNDDYDDLKNALQKLSLNDASFTWEPETSEALGFGFRCGFLGMLHMEIVQERLEREYDLDLVATTPNVIYVVTTTDGVTEEFHSPVGLPDFSRIEAVAEPYIRATIVTPPTYIGNIMRLCEEKRGGYSSTEYLDPERVLLTFELPLAEVVLDFYDRLKSVTRGYASFDYDLLEPRVNELEKLEILVNGQPVDALSIIIHKDKAYQYGRNLTLKLQKLIPRQLFEVAIQAKLGGRIIARENVKPLRKDVTAKCYGGDITRKRKLLEKQKKGKKRMKMVGTVEIPQRAFMSVLGVEDDPHEIRQKYGRGR